MTDAKEKADILLDEFSGVFTNEDTNSIPWLGPGRSKIEDITFSPDGIEQLLASLQPHKASGPDRIPNRVLKELSPVLALLFTQSLHTGTIPNDWSNALIAHVFKK